jgi:hypothetical protein
MTAKTVLRASLIVQGGYFFSACYRLLPVRGFNIAYHNDEPSSKVCFEPLLLIVTRPVCLYKGF